MSVCTCDFCSLRIFVVEDHTDTLEALKEIPMADCHILISDINLPDGNGWELMQELENLSPHYAIAMSGYGMKADCERSAQSGFRYHLVKPVSPHRLDTLLEEATNELKEKH